jgi:hypothetical protein
MTCHWVIVQVDCIKIWTLRKYLNVFKMFQGKFVVVELKEEREKVSDRGEKGGEMGDDI